MEKSTIPDSILSDDAVSFISERHHTTAREVLDSYAARLGDSIGPRDTTVRLEDNEVQIICDLIKMYGKDIL